MRVEPQVATSSVWCQTRFGLAWVQAERADRGRRRSSPCTKFAQQSVSVLETLATAPSEAPIFSYCSVPYSYSALVPSACSAGLGGTPASSRRVCHRPPAQPSAGHAHAPCGRAAALHGRWCHRRPDPSSASSMIFWARTSPRRRSHAGRICTMSTRRPPASIQTACPASRAPPHYPTCALSHTPRRRLRAR